MPASTPGSGRGFGERRGPFQALGQALGGLTTRGRCFIAAGLACLLSAVLVGQSDLLRVAVLLVALPLTAAGLLARTRYRLACRRNADPARVAVGEQSRVTVWLDNVSRLPVGVLLVEDAMPSGLGAPPRFVLDRVEPGGHRGVTYAVQPACRGRYRIGPLRVRLTDPFGFCELTRSFTGTDELVVSPATVPLLPIRIGGAWTGGADGTTRGAATAGDDDVATRDYRQGDELRRVHWRSTARTGQLMVRREEQPWQHRALVLLDSRASAHRGRANQPLDSSFEWAVAAAASVSVHLAERDYAVRLLTADGGGTRTARSDLARLRILDELATVQAGPERSLGSALSRLATAGEGAIVAVLGRLEDDDVAQLVRAGIRSGLAVLVDTGGWVAGAESRAAGDPVRRARDALRVAGWRVAIGGRGTSVAGAWSDLALARPAALL